MPTSRSSNPLFDLLDKGLDVYDGVKTQQLERDLLRMQADYQLATQATTQPSNINAVTADPLRDTVVATLKDPINVTLLAVAGLLGVVLYKLA